MTQQQAIDKALKLLRLAKSSNQHEAALAAAHAQRIIDEHKLDIEAIDYDAQDKERDAEQVKDFGLHDPIDQYGNKSDNRWMFTLTTILSNANQCDVICYAIHTDEFKRGARLRIIGCPSDVQTSRYLYAVLKNEVQRLAKENCLGNSLAYKRAFCLGVVDTIYRKLQEQQRKTHADARAKYASNSMALVRVNQALAKIERRTQAVAQYIKDNLDTHASRGGFSTADSAAIARAHGRKAGESINLSGAKAALGSGKHQIGN